MIDTNRPITAFVLALASVILTPVLLFIEFTALFFASMVTYEPANPLWIKVIVVVVVVLIGLFTLSVSVAAGTAILQVYLILMTIGLCSLEGC